MKRSDKGLKTHIVVVKLTVAKNAANSAVKKRMPRATKKTHPLKQWLAVPILH